MPTRTEIEAPDAPSAVGGYAQALAVDGATRLLFVSGQIPERPDGSLPDTFEGQCRQAWANVEAQLKAAGMTFADIVKVTIFLGSREHAAENRRVRQEVLGMLRPAMTVIVTGIFDERWLLEIEAVAAC